MRIHPSRAAGRGRGALARSIAFGVAVLAWGLLVPPSALADTIILKNGNRLDGKVVKEKASEVIFRTKGMEMAIPREDIQEIQKSGHTDPPRPPLDTKPPEPPPPPGHEPGPKPADPPPPVVPPSGPAVSLPDASAPDLDLTPQSPRVTLDASDRPVDEVLYKIGKQAGRQIEWEGDEKKNVSVSVQNAPFWEPLVQACRQSGVGFTIYSQPGNPIKAPGMSSHPIRLYDVKGPVLLAWHGLVEDDKFDFSVTPAVSRKVRTLSLEMRLDPACQVRIKDPVLKPEFTFVTAQGGRIVRKADEEAQDGMGGRAWRFEPAGGTPEEPSEVEVSIPLWIPGAPVEASLPWVEGGKGAAGSVTASIAKLSAEAGKPVSADLSLAVSEEVRKADAAASAALLARLNAEKRPPTPSETALLEGGSRVLSIHRIVLVLENGARVAGRTGGGMSGPYASNYRIEFGDAPAAKPKELEISWSEGLSPLTVPFRLKDKPSAAAVAGPVTPAPAKPPEPEPDLPPPPAFGAEFKMAEKAAYKKDVFGIHALALSPDARRIAAGFSMEGKVRILSVPRLEEATALFGSDKGVQSVAFSPDGKRVFAGDTGGFVKAWTLENEKEAGSYKVGEMWVYRIAVSPDGRRLALGSMNGTRILDAVTLAEVAKIEKDSRLLAFSPDGSILAVGGDFRDPCTLVKADTGEKIGDLEDSDDVGIVGFLDASTAIGVSSRARAIAIWDVPTRKIKSVFEGSKAGGPVALSADGAYFAAADGPPGGDIRVYDVKAGKEVALLKGHTSWVNALSFSQDGRFLVSGGSDAIRFWARE